MKVRKVASPVPLSACYPNGTGQAAYLWSTSCPVFAAGISYRQSYCASGGTTLSGGFYVY